MVGGFVLYHNDSAKAYELNVPAVCCPSIVGSCFLLSQTMVVQIKGHFVSYCNGLILFKKHPGRRCVPLLQAAAKHL